jgi:hypothetical protein
MSLNHFCVVLAVVTAAVYAMFWSIGLFSERPRRSRILWVAMATAAYVGLQLGAAFAGQFGLYALVRALHGGVYHPWSLLLFVASTAASLRLVTFRRGPSRHRFAYAWLSWILVVALVGTAVKIAFGVKPPPGAIESIAVALFAWRLFAHQGNLAHLLRSIGATCRRLVLGRPS